MMPKFLQLINSIEGELKIEYLGGAIRWIDETENNAWSDAIDRFDNALAVAIERKDYQLAQLEGEHYKTKVLGMIARYKKHKRMEGATSFLDQIKTDWNKRQAR